MRDYAIGIDVGASKLGVGLFGKEMHLICKRVVDTDIEWNDRELIDRLASLVNEVIAEADVSRREIRGVGAAFPSYIDYDEGVVVETSYMHLLSDKPLRAMLCEALQLPVWIDNDANAAGLAEHELGAGRGEDHMIYVTLSSGIGGALFLNGKLYRGMHGMAGEIGHMFISDSTGYSDTCGVTGCVQSIASGIHMAKYAMDRIKEGEESRILDYAGTLSRIDMIAVRRAWLVGDALATEIIERAADYLGRMFHSLNEIFDINVFVYGGGVCKLGYTFINKIIESYNRYTHRNTRYPAKFLAAEMGDDAGLIGAALLVEKDAET